MTPEQHSKEEKTKRILDDLLARELGFPPLTDEEFDSVWAHRPGQQPTQKE